MEWPCECSGGEAPAKASPGCFTCQSLLSKGPAALSEVWVPALVPQGAGSDALRSPAALAGTPLLYWPPLTSVGLRPSPLPIRVGQAQVG